MGPSLACFMSSSSLLPLLLLLQLGIVLAPVTVTTVAAAADSRGAGNDGDANDANVCVDLPCVCVGTPAAVECHSANAARDALQLILRRRARQQSGARQPPPPLREFSCVRCGLVSGVRLSVDAINVNVSHNRIEDVLAGSSHVFNLDVAGNQLSTLDFTRHFVHLRRLYASANRLVELRPIRLPSLAVLDISNNQIVDMDRHTFADLSELTVLNLSGNQLQHLRFEWFTPLGNLDWLSLGHNRLLELNNLVFRPLARLRVVDLSHNQLTHVGMLSFQAIGLLEQLDLSHNNLSSLPGHFCKWFGSLQLLDVSANPLQSLANVCTLPASASFSLRARNLSALKVILANDTVGLENMVSLDLAGGALEAIEPASFERLTELRDLDLSHCALSTLARGLFLPLVSLERVNLQGNAWHCDCGLKWLLYFFLHRPNLHLENFDRTVCSTETTDGGPARLLHEERLLDFVDRRVHCENATVANFTRNAHFRLGSTAVLFCQQHGTPIPTLTWYSKSLGALNACGSSCSWESGASAAAAPAPANAADAAAAAAAATGKTFGGERSRCSGCRMARWTCSKQALMCDTDECRRYVQECLRLVDAEEADGSCCSAAHLKRAVETCLSHDLATDSEAGQCLREVAALISAPLNAGAGAAAAIAPSTATNAVALRRPAHSNDTRTIMERLDSCVAMRRRCVEDCVDEGTAEGCEDRREKQCVEPSVTCALDVLAREAELSSAAVNTDVCQGRICTRGQKLYISNVARGDSGYYMCRASNVLQTQQVTIHVTLDYDFLGDVKVFSILTGLGVAILFTIATVIGVGVEKILEHFGLKCPCDADGPIRRQNIVKILEQIESYRRQNLERLRENYNWQVARIKENCILQMDRVKDSYIAEQTGKIRDYGSSQIGVIKDNYMGQVQRVRDYGNTQMDWLRENYVFQRNRIHKFSKHQLIRLRENYKLQQKHLNKILETLPNLESCRKGFYSETDLRELNFTALLVPPPPPPESVLDFPAFDEFSLPDVHTDGPGSCSGTLLSHDGSSVADSMPSERRTRRAYPTIEQVIRERLLPMAEEAALRAGAAAAAAATGPEAERQRQMFRGHRRSYSAPITAAPLTTQLAPSHERSEAAADQQRHWQHLHQNQPHTSGVMARPYPSYAADRVPVTAQQRQHQYYNQLVAAVAAAAAQSSQPPQIPHLGYPHRAQYLLLQQQQQQQQQQQLQQQQPQQQCQQQQEQQWQQQARALFPQRRLESIEQLPVSPNRTPSAEAASSSESRTEGSSQSTARIPSDEILVDIELQLQQPPPLPSRHSPRQSAAAANNNDNTNSKRNDEDKDNQDDGVTVQIEGCCSMPNSGSAGVVEQDLTANCNDENGGPFVPQQTDL